MSEKEKNNETPSENEEETTDPAAEGSTPTADAETDPSESVDDRVDTVADTDDAPAESAEGEESPDDAEEEEEKKVAYELLDATPRAGSIVDVKFKVPYSEYEEKTAEFYKELRGTVIIDGFRPGKAPLKLIQNRYHKQVKQDALDFLVDNCARQVAEEKDYSILRDFDRVDPEVNENEDLEFAISFEIQPKLEPVGYDKFKFTVDTVKVDDAAVDAEIEKVRQRHATYQTSDVMPFERGHGITVDIQVADDKGEEIEDLTRKDLFLARPENSLPEQVVNELVGQSAGDTIKVKVPNVRKSEGGVITSEQDSYVVKVVEVKRRVLPDLDDQFAKDLGVESLEAMREQFKEHLTSNQERQVRDDSLEKIYTELIEKNEFELPETMVRRVQAQMLHEHTERLRSLGFNLEDLGEDPREYVVRTRENAERLLRVMMLNQAIAEKEKIEATDEDMDKAIEKRAQQEGRRALAIRANLEAHKQLDEFRDDLKYDLVNDFLLGKAEIDKQFVSPEKKIDTGA